MFFWCIKADIVSPEMSNSSNVLLQTFNGGPFVYWVSLLNELEVELIKISLYINTL